ncbi:uncharacterized protein LOC107264460 [Cephus cinctus]|uniref:Uncharacterized protein LOC107264460 n=1 Tax=Cephus cinctus TaxID=211228 RepID=A0AAJ7RBN2_CEPCN|nr:uncharacterized protein LOC107264460 [Cephus cinctus]
MQAFQGIPSRITIGTILTRVPCKSLTRNFSQVTDDTGKNPKSKLPDPEANKINPESERMKKFHEKLKLQPLQRLSPGMRYVDLLLVETDPKSGELVANTEKDPTKWGDWQNGGRVSDF